MKPSLIFATALCACAAASPAFAASVKVVDPWFRALPSGLPAGGYFVMHNLGDADISLTGVESPACGTAMLHKTSSEGGMEHMDHVDSVAVPAHGEVRFKPGSYHVMCMKPTSAMEPGRDVAVTFQFADGTKTTVPFRVFGPKGKP